MENKTILANAKKINASHFIKTRFGNRVNDFQNDESGTSTILFTLFKQQLLTF